MNIDTSNLEVLATRTSQYPVDDLPEFLLLGRSNVGKSSFINTILNRKNYAKVSSKPGKTQTLNFYLVNEDFYLVDAPGYGYAAVNKQQQKKFGLMIEEYLRNREHLERVFLLIDYRHKPSEDDRLMYEFLKYYQVPITIIATKFDKVKKNNREKQNKLIKEQLKLDNLDEVIFFSAINKRGKEDVYEIIKNYLAERE
ncbi:MAG: YihA family ribosome biogenesis GTP-binding protein [Mollicutes bacterium]|jgi:GTP-binding protein|nr:YihA family ribosome biogenesis GTP-binding protein [Mollicutes bacterium]